MRKVILTLLLFVSYSFLLKGQVVLLREGVVINSSETGTWLGDKIPHTEQTQLTYRNNSISSVNTVGYLLCAGDETPSATNNNLDGAVITGNKFEWLGANTPQVITHGLFTGYNVNTVVKYNFLTGVPYGIIFKSGTDEGENMTFTTGGCAYNICRNGKFGARMKGINGVKIYNNTFYNDDNSGWYLLYISANEDRLIKSLSTASKVFNNIFYSASQIPMIKVDPGCDSGFECDYNLYWCKAGPPVFMFGGVIKSWDEWRSLGYDRHSVIADPAFLDTLDLVPANRLDFGMNLGVEWQEGLSVLSSWKPGISPETTIQNGTWQVGARIYADIKVSEIIISGEANTISTDKGTLQLTATVLPETATNKAVTWSLTNGSGEATISQGGLFTAINDGTVTAIATATDGSGVFGLLEITITNQVIPVSSITITGEGGSNAISTNNGTLQLSATVLPETATNKSVKWSLTSGSGEATISPGGLVTAISNGTVTATATATDGSGVVGLLEITITNQVIPVSSIAITGEGGSNAISTNNGTLQLMATVLPETATNKTVEWSIIDDAGLATISESGLVTAVKNGSVTVQAVASDGSGVAGLILITIINQLVLVSSINIEGENGSDSIFTDKGTLRLSAAVFPVDATDKSVTWSITEGADLATINPDGLVCAKNNGTVTATAFANDGSGVSGSMHVNISNQVILSDGIQQTGKPETFAEIVSKGDRWEIRLNRDYHSYKIYIYSLTGVLLQTEDIEGQVTTVQTSRLVPGIYMLVITNNNTLNCFKVVKL